MGPSQAAVTHVGNDHATARQAMVKAKMCFTTITFLQKVRLLVGILDFVSRITFSADIIFP